MFVFPQLTLRGNNFKGGIPDLRNKPHLALIDFSDNQFTGDFASKLSSCVIIIMNGKRESTKHSCISTRVDIFMTSYRLSYCCAANVPLLENVQLSGNAFVGHLPDLTGVTRLTHLNVANNCTWNGLCCNL